MVDVNEYFGDVKSVFVICACVCWHQLQALFFFCHGVLSFSEQLFSCQCLVLNKQTQHLFVNE